jgi:Pyruvate phosphate dikinase, AMP/ATP-binding domain
MGPGEAIVSGCVTPDTIVIHKPDAAIASEQIADKEIMTVRTPEGTREEPVPAGKRKQAALDPSQAAELARLGVQIEQLYGQAMDIEWALRDGQIFILQARPITALPQARATVDWKVPHAHGSPWALLPHERSRDSARAAFPAVRNARLALMERCHAAHHGQGDRLPACVDPADHGPRLVGLPLRLPGVVKLVRSAYARWAEETRPRFAAVTREWTARDLAATPARELLAGAQQLVDAAASYYVSIQLVLGVANISEPAFNTVYNRLIRRKSDPPALTFLLGFDSMPIRAEKSLYDLAMWARGQAQPGANSLSDLPRISIISVMPSTIWISPRAFPQRHLNRSSKRSSTSSPARAAIPTNARPWVRKRGIRLPQRSSLVSAGCACDSSGASSALRSAGHRGAKTRSPTSALADPFCAVCCAKSGAAWSLPARSATQATSSG